MSSDDWLVWEVTILGIPFQNWMIIMLALMLIAALINVLEKG